MAITPPVISDLLIRREPGSNQYYASWILSDPYISYDDSSKIKTKKYVYIPPAGTKKYNPDGTLSDENWWPDDKPVFYNGTAIDVTKYPTIFTDPWYVYAMSGNKVTLTKSLDGLNDLKKLTFNKTYLKLYVPPEEMPQDPSGPIEAPVSKELEHLENYEVKWYYTLGTYYNENEAIQNRTIIWFSGNDGTSSEPSSTYGAPENAIKIKVSVQAIAKVKSGKTKYWTSNAVVKEYVIDENDPPEKPAAPSLELNKNKLTCSLEGIEDPLADRVEFVIYKDSDTNPYNTGEADVKLARVSYSFDVEDGAEYVVKCRAKHIVDGLVIEGEWSPLTSKQPTRPLKPEPFTSVQVKEKTQVYLYWDAVPAAKQYTIEYTTDLENFEMGVGADQSVQTENTYYRLIVEPGTEYFIRYCGTNDAGNSEWSDVYRVIVGLKPSAPTTWSSKNSASTNDNINLYWIHNSEDSSSQTYAQIRFTTKNDQWVETIDRTGIDDEHKDDTAVYVLSTDDPKFTEGSYVNWEVRTAGILTEKVDGVDVPVYGEWSVKREINIYVQPNLNFKMTNVNGNQFTVLNTLPIHIEGSCTENSYHHPIGYQLIVTSNDTYDTVDGIGDIKTVMYNEELYNEFFDTDRFMFETELNAGNLSLENGMSYTVKCILTMNSGMTAEAEKTFTVEWEVSRYVPNADIVVDSDTLSAFISPYCSDNNDNLIDGVLLSVYRISYDGEMIEIAKDLDNTLNINVTDPHPSLNYAKYRIVSKLVSTGAMAFYDVPPVEVGEYSIVIQWNERSKGYTNADQEILASPTIVGSVVKLPYNVDVSDSNSNDVSLIKYAGREYPVSYYGTQIGHTSNMSSDIPRYDTDTIDKLRRLQRWMGDVYIREPNGTGYWANINVSFSTTHCQTSIPVSVSVTRVEGGI